MTIKSLLASIKPSRAALKDKGIRYAYNCAHFKSFWGSKSYFLLKLMHSFEFYPSYIEIEVTTRCNLKCIMCEHTYWNEPNRDMSFEEFKMIVDQFPRLKWIGVTGIGESFLNKDFMKMLRYVKNKPIFVEMFDTFYFIDEDVGKELIELGIGNILLSVDAATKETYEKLRKGSNFDRVITNIKNFVDLKAKVNAYFPTLLFHYVVTKLNCFEIPQYIEMVHSLTSKIAKEQVGIRFSRMLHEFDEIKNLFMEVPEETIRIAEKKAKELGIKIEWNADVPKTKPPVSRCKEWIMPFIFVTGHVVPCCAGNEANRREFQKETALGNVFEQSFRDIWYGEKYKKLRRMLSRGEVPIQCRNCCIYDVTGRDYSRNHDYSGFSKPRSR